MNFFLTFPLMGLSMVVEMNYLELEFSPITVGLNVLGKWRTFPVDPPRDPGDQTHAVLLNFNA